MSSVCRWLGGLASPGNMKQSDVKIMIGEMMTVSALLSGFAIGMSTKVTDGQIRSYASFNKAEFLGKHSHLCDFDRRVEVEGGVPPLGNPLHVPGGNTCSADGCWGGHYAVPRLAEALGVVPCEMTVGEMKALDPTFWDNMVEEKVLAVQLELGYNTMFIIFTTVCVAFTGSLLRLSIIKRSDCPKTWMRRFYPLVFLLACLPLVNFYNFLNLASRVIRVIYPCAHPAGSNPRGATRCEPARTGRKRRRTAARRRARLPRHADCDDFISGHCMVTATPGWDWLLYGLGVVFFLVLLNHLLLPEADPAGDADGAAAGAGSPVSQLTELARLKEQGALSDEEFRAAKGAVLASAKSASKVML